MQAYCMLCIYWSLLGKPLKGCYRIYRCVESPMGTIIFDLQTCVLDVLTYRHHVANSFPMCPVPCAMLVPFSKWLISLQKGL